MHGVIKKIQYCNIFKKCCKKQNIILLNDELNSIEDECGICLEKLKNNICLKMENCNHIFHVSCYKKYLNYNNNIATKCPICSSSQEYINNILLNY